MPKNCVRFYFFCLIFGCNISRADMVATINYFQYSKTEQLQGEATSQSLLTSYDFNLQFLLGSRFLIGATYMKQTSAADIRNSRESVFPNVGFFYGPLLFEGGPVSKSVDRLNLDNNSEWRDATGYYGAITIYHSWAQRIIVGFQFTFLDIEYRKYFDGINESSNRTRKVSVLNPSLRLSFLF